GLDGHDYEAFTVQSVAKAPAQPAEQESLNAVWQDVLEQVAPGLAAGLVGLARSGAAPPAVGLELTDEKGVVPAGAELAWPGRQLALLRPDQADLVDTWKAAGWTVEILDDGPATVGGRSWEAAVAARLA